MSLQYLWWHRNDPLPPEPRPQWPWPSQRPWVCPKCGRANAPTLMTCPCWRALAEMGVSDGDD